MRCWAVLAAVALVGCATPYQDRSGLKGVLGGVTAQRIDETTFQVVASGNGFTDTATIARYMIRKSAETTVAAGYQYFIFVNIVDQGRTATTTTSGHANTTATATSFGTVSGFGNTATYNGFGSANATTTYTPPSTQTVFKPGGAATVKMLHERPAEMNGVYDAAEVVRFMTPPNAQ